MRTFELHVTFAGGTLVFSHLTLADADAQLDEFKNLSTSSTPWVTIRGVDKPPYYELNTSQISYMIVDISVGDVGAKVGATIGHNIGKTVGGIVSGK
jgi:hypothetical protein